jgi:hypothetical protein
MAVWLFLYLFLASSAQGHADARDPNLTIGHVIAFGGLWCDSTVYDCKTPNGKNIIGRMYPVRRGAKLVRMGALTGREWLRVRSYLTGLEVTFTCSIAVDCRDLLDLERLYPAEGEAGPDGILAAFLKAIRRMAATEPVVYERYRQGLMRAESPVNTMQDALARLDAQGLHLEQVLIRLPLGSYELEVCRIDQKAALRCPSEPHPAKFHWDPDHQHPWALRDVQPGLYRLYVCQATSKGFVRTDSYASVLALDATAYARLSPEFHAVASLARDWASDDPTASTMLRMYLQDMAFRSSARASLQIPADSRRSHCHY